MMKDDDTPQIAAALLFLLYAATVVSLFGGLVVRAIL